MDTIAGKQKNFWTSYEQCPSCIAIQYIQFQGGISMGQQLVFKMIKYWVFFKVQLRLTASELKTFT